MAQYHLAIAAAVDDGYLWDSLDQGGGLLETGLEAGGV